MFKVCEPVFRTLHQEKDSSRVRSIKPGEDVKSMWDQLETNAHAFKYTPGNHNPQEMKAGIDETFVYTEADEIEDSILFPEEGTGEMKDNVFRANPSLLEMFEKKPNIDLRRFARDLDSDEELSEDDSLFEPDEGYEVGEAEDDDGDEAWETDSEEDMYSEDEDDYVYDFANDSDVDVAMQALEDRFRKQTIYTKGKHNHLQIQQKRRASCDPHC